MQFLHTLWKALVYAYAVASAIMRGGFRIGAGILWLGAVALTGLAAGVLTVLALAAVAIFTPFHDFLNTYSNVITWLGILAGAAYAVHRSVKQYRLRYPHSDVLGSATFMDRRAVATLTSGDGLIIGREIKPNGKPGRLLRDDGPAHLLSLAPTRSGKGVGAIIPNLLTADRSTVCTDPKGENARATYQARKRFGPVHVLDPFGITGLPAAAYNPLDGLDPNSLDLAEDAATIADALVNDPPGQVAEAHWNEEAKALLTGLILYVVCHEQPQDRTLATVRDYLSLNPENFRGLLKLMQDSTAAGGLIARAANRHLSKADREAAGVLSSAQRHTHFLDSPRMAAVMARSDFRFAQLKDKTASVFLVLPPDRLGTYSRWLRLMVAQAITDMARSPVQPPSPVLFLLDEFAALGPLEPVVRAYGLMAGYGMQLWAILQDLHQLRSLYGPRAGTFLSNAGVSQVFNVNDVETAAWVSRTLGATTEAYETTSQNVSYGKDAPFLGTRSEGIATHLVRRDLFTPDEVMRLPSNCMILLRQGSAPILARKVTYYADPEFRGLFGTSDASTSPPARAVAVPAE